MTGLQNKLDPADFTFLQSLLLREGGMVVDPNKEYLLTTRLGPLAEVLGLDGIPEILKLLRIGDTKMRKTVVEAMTINETSWFRDPTLWGDIERLLLPTIIQARTNLKRIDIWVAASSSGQEVYSLAMLITEILGSDMKFWRVRILATDLSNEMVQRTAKGEFSGLEMSRGLSPERRERFMRPEGTSWVVKDELRSMVTARPTNLTAADNSVRGPFDLIFMRNVLIYFTPEMRAQILGRQADLLATHGHLVLGASEGALGVPTSLQSSRFGRLVAYQRSDVAPVTVRSTGSVVAPKPASPLAGLAKPATSPTGLAKPASPLAGLTKPASPLAGLTKPATPLAGLAKPATPATAARPLTPAKPAAAGTPDDGLSPIERLRLIRQQYAEQVAAAEKAKQKP